MTDSDAVLAANLGFYRAFAARDLAAMAALWARAVPVACTHPGWPALAGREAVMESWHGILANPEAPRIACHDERVLLWGDTALVLCEEELEGGTLVASNLFVREEGAWRLAHHHAGQLAVRPQARRPERPPRSRLN
jgi:ketosteroid isomerase-like protein